MADGNLQVKIPVELLKEFKMEPRLVIRHPWLIGIPIPDILRQHEIVKQFEKAGFEVMIVPGPKMYK